MTDVSHGTACTVFPPQVICLNKDLLLSSSSFAFLYLSFFSNALHAGAMPWSFAILCNVVKEIYGPVFFAFWRAAPPLSALAKNLLWSRSCEFHQWGYLTDRIPVCLRNVLSFKIHNNKAVSPYSACSLLIPGLAGFAHYTDRNLVVASERKKKNKNW